MKDMLLIRSCCIHGTPYTLPFASKIEIGLLQQTNTPIVKPYSHPVSQRTHTHTHAHIFEIKPRFLDSRIVVTQFLASLNTAMAIRNTSRHSPGYPAKMRIGFRISYHGDEVGLQLLFVGIGLVYEVRSIAKWSIDKLFFGFYCIKPSNRCIGIFDWLQQQGGLCNLLS